MNILVTGANGFVGKNLTENLYAIKNGYNQTRPNIKIDNIFKYDLNNTIEELENYCKNADFVFNLAGTNRPKDSRDFMKNNFGFSNDLLKMLRKYKNKCPVMLSSSIQATLIGRYGNSDYGKSKLACENTLFSYGKETGAKVLVYRFPNLFGKWSKPNYNSVVATFCYNIANDLPIQVNDASTELELLYIDDLINEMLDALEGKEHHCEYDGLIPIEKPNGKYCHAPATYRVTLGQIVHLLHTFKNEPETLQMPSIPDQSFTKKLYSTYLSFLPEKKFKYALNMKRDSRGSFTELLKTSDHGQFSVNISKPGVTKGQHWHNTKWEFFIVVSGHAKIQERKIGIDPSTGKDYPVIEFEVSSDKIEAVHMIPGYTHNIINLSATDDLVTLMWANEQFDPLHPDTFHENVI
ncbi:NAD-dependent epimerase/dehydratase family protein [Sharpea azabuensis]|uniref:polysaccharide biosynthesis C-terminal domain-containing protein n=1 Tax=Sharpea azabuensis TaxID=322505 RepID=UPI0013DC63A7|nr:NAD-dependent epimerase/dehydratase family protein [Sharpea azabuensis]